MSVPSHRTPKYRLHRPSGQAVVTIAGKDFYLGRYDSADSRAEYDRLVGEWLTSGRQRPGKAPASGPDLSVNELLVAYLGHVDGYYRKNGEPTSEPKAIRLALRPLRRLYGHAAARDFGPLALKSVRRSMVESGLCRTEVNKRVGRVLRAFKWAVGEELVPAHVLQALGAVPGLRKGRTEARESSPVRPVPDASVDAVRPHVSRQVWAMIELQRFTGMRPGEVTRMRACDLDTSGAVWVYSPDGHKSEHHGRGRAVYLGPQAQAAVRPWLRDDPATFLFSPAEAVAERRAAMRERRKTKVQPSQRDRSKARPKRKPRDRYDVPAYNRAIEYGCKKAGLPKWHPHQLRHNAGTQIRREFGLEVARAVLGHSSITTTEIYAETDAAKASAAMGRLG